MNPIMSESKTELSDTTIVVTQSFSKRNQKTRIGAHFRRWWWIYAIIVICIALVVILPVIFVAYPRIAQGDVNKSTLDITRMEISNPTPDSFHLAQAQTLGSKSFFHPTIFSFGATVSLAGSFRSFGSVTVPQVKAENGVTVRIDQDLRVTDKTALVDFAKTALLNETVGLNVHGKSKLRLGALQKIKVTYDKTVRIKGLNKLEGFNITQLDLFSRNEPDGTNGKGMVYVPNASMMTVALGNVTLDLNVNSTYIGQTFINDLTLHPGNNTVPMTVKVDKLAAANMMPNDGMLPVRITGNSSVVDGRELTYFSEALQANTLYAKLDISKALM